MDVGRLLVRLGVHARRERGRWVAPCPSPGHDDSSPSWSIVDRPGDRRHASHKCFGCDLKGGPWELAAVIWGCSLTEAGRRLRDEDFVRDVMDGGATRMGPGLTRRAFKLPARYILPKTFDAWEEGALSYLLNVRGMTRSQIVRWRVGYMFGDRRDRADRVVFPVVTGGRVVNFTARMFRGQSSNKYMTGQREDGAEKRNALMGDQFLDESLGVACVTEGAFKIASLERAGWPNPCAILGSSVGPLVALRLSRFRLVVSATDPDQAGDKAASALSLLSRRGVPVVRARLRADPDEIPDDELREERRKFFSDLSNYGVDNLIRVGHLVR